MPGVGIGRIGVAAALERAATAPTVPPGVTASDALTERVLTVMVGASTGVPPPALALTALTLDDVDVLGDAVAVTPGQVWTYTVPDSADAQTVAWEVSAFNTPDYRPLYNGVGGSPVTVEQFDAGGDAWVSFGADETAPLGAIGPALDVQRLTGKYSGFCRAQATPTTCATGKTYRAAVIVRPDAGFAQSARLEMAIEGTTTGLRNRVNVAGLDTPTPTVTFTSGTGGVVVTDETSAKVTALTGALAGFYAIEVEFSMTSPSIVWVRGVSAITSNPLTNTIDVAAGGIEEVASAATLAVASGSEVVPANLGLPEVPELTASDSLAGRNLTITVDTLTGNPAPTAVLETLTLDGADVLGDATGTGPWVYAVPNSAAEQIVAWTVRAANIAGSDTASGSEAVAANLTVPALAPAMPLSALLTAAPNDIGGASWTAATGTPARTALAVEDDVQPYRLASANFPDRLRPATTINTEVGKTYVAVFVGRHVAGQRIGTGIELESESNYIRARVMANATSGTPDYLQTINGGSPVESNLTGRAIALERLPGDFLRIVYYFTRVGINATARTAPFWMTGGNTGFTVDGYRCGLFQLLRPAASAVAVSDTEIALSLDAGWGGWALGASVEYRVDAGSAVAVPEPGVTIITVAGPGTYTVERREVWPQASIPGVSPLMVGGGSSFSTQWAEV